MTVMFVISDFELVLRAIILHNWLLEIAVSGCDSPVFVFPTIIIWLNTAEQHPV